MPDGLSWLDVTAFHRIKIMGWFRVGLIFYIEEVVDIVMLVKLAL